MKSEGRPPRGVRLGDLDRSRVYHLAWVTRRWEVVGSEPAPVAGSARQGRSDEEREGPRARERHGPPAPQTAEPGPRHSAPAP